VQHRKRHIAHVTLSALTVRQQCVALVQAGDENLECRDHSGAVSGDDFPSGESFPFGIIFPSFNVWRVKGHYGTSEMCQ
jgi:hypothetical protein